MQTFADHWSRRRHIRHMTDKKRWDLVSLRNVKSEEQARVSSGRLFHARAAATGKAGSPRVARWVDGTCSVVVSAEWRQRQATISDIGRKLSGMYAGALDRQQDSVCLYVNINLQHSFAFFNCVHLQTTVGHGCLHLPFIILRLPYFVLNQSSQSSTKSLNHPLNQCNLTPPCKPQPQSWKVTS